MAGTSETLLEARIISTAFGCLSSRSAGGDRSATNRSSRPGPLVLVTGSTVAVSKQVAGQAETRRQGRGWDQALCQGQWDPLLPEVRLYQREGLGHNEHFGKPGGLVYKRSPGPDSWLATGWHPGALGQFGEPPDQISSTIQWFSEDGAWTHPPPPPKPS